MIVISQQDFLGANLEIDPKRLGPGFGVSANNMRPGAANLRPWNGALAVYTVPGGGAQRLSLYRMGRALASDVNYWLSWLTDVDVVRSLLADDTTERIYYTGDGVPKTTDNVLALATAPYPTAFRTLGVPAPSGVIGLAVLAAGAGTIETRTYVDTFVTDRGEESAPNPGVPSIAIAATGTVTLSSLPAVPGGSTGITLRRIYVSSGGEYRQIVQQASNLTTAVDNLARGTVLASGGNLARPAWLEPPATLKGLIELWNGMIGGFLGKSLRVCEPYKPHAWPIEYENVVHDDIVGTGKWSQNWLVLTTGGPRLFVGSSPLALNEVPVEFQQACVAKRSIVNMGHGVCWASPDGLAYMGQGGPRILTQDIVSPANWKATFNPATIVGARLEHFYFCSYVGADTLRRSFLIDPLSPQGIITLDPGAFAMFYDTVQDQLYLLGTGNVVNKWDAGSALTATFKSGLKRVARECNPGVVQVIADTYPVQFTLWGDGTQRHTVAIANRNPHRLPGGYMAQDFQVQVSGTTAVQGVLVAEDAQDLQ